VTTTSAELVRAALIWDVPALARSGDADAASFLSAMRLEPVRDLDRSQHGRTALSLAATGLSLELSGDLETAVTFYDRLARRPGLPGLLGAFLRIWSSVATPVDIDPLVDRIQRGPEIQLRPYLLTKLLTIAWVQGWHEELDKVYDLAVEAAAATAPSSLSVRLTLFGWNVLRRQLELPLPPTPKDDPIVQQAWVHESMKESLLAVEHRRFEESIKSPWTWTLRMGGAIDQQLIATEMQATWAAMIGDLREFRRSVGEQLILSSESTAGQKVQGLGAYLFSRQGSLPQVVRAVEPHLSQGIDSELSKLVDLNVSPRETQYYYQALAALWDLLPAWRVDQLLTGMSLDFDYSDGFNPPVDLFGLLGRRNPAAWWKRYQSCNELTRARIMAAGPPGFAIGLPDELGDEIRREVLLVCKRAPQPTRVLLATAAAMATRRAQFTSDAQLPLWLISDASSDEPRWLTKSVRRNAVNRLKAGINAEIAESRQGKYGFGGFDLVFGYGSIVLGVETPADIRFLLSLANDESIAGNFRVSALSALVQIARRNELSFDAVSTVAESAGQVYGPSFVQPDFVDLFTGLRDSLIMLSDSADRVGAMERVIATLKSSSERARIEATASLAVYVRRSERAEAATHLYSTLFDPQPEVVLQGLQGINAGYDVNPSLRVGIVTRLGDLFLNSERSLRAAVVRVAYDLAHRDPSGRLGTILLAAQVDRSWVVRRTYERLHGGG
jgi:hypothetical protein